MSFLKDFWQKLFGSTEKSDYGKCCVCRRRFKSNELNLVDEGDGVKGKLICDSCATKVGGTFGGFG